MFINVFYITLSRFLYLLLGFYVILRYKKYHFYSSLIYYENQIMFNISELFLTKKFVVNLFSFRTFLIKYNSFLIYKYSYGHSIRWLIKRINLLTNKCIKSFYLEQSSFFKYFDNWQYTKQYRFLGRFYPKRSILWKLKNHFGALNPYNHNFWVFGDQSSSIYILKFTWIPKNI